MIAAHDLSPLLNAHSYDLGQGLARHFLEAHSSKQLADAFTNINEPASLLLAASGAQSFGASFLTCHYSAG